MIVPANMQMISTQLIYYWDQQVVPTNPTTQQTIQQDIRVAEMGKGQNCGARL